jgi:hypothetical protein
VRIPVTSSSNASIYVPPKNHPAQNSPNRSDIPASHCFAIETFSPVSHKEKDGKK